MRSIKYITIIMLAISLSAKIPVQTFILPSGLTCKLIENHERPLIRIELVHKWGPDALESGKTGLGELLAATIRQKTVNEYNNKKHNIQYGELTFKAELGSYYWSLTTDNIYHEAAIQLLADSVMRPNINQAIVEIQRQNLLKRYKLASLYSRALSQFLHSIEDPEELLPIDASTLSQVSYQNLLEFKQLVIRPETSVIAIYGDLNLEQAKQLIFLHFGTWGSLKKPKPLQLTYDNAYTNSPKIITTSENESKVELWAGTSCSNNSITQATNILLPIVLNNIAKSFSSDFQIIVSLSENLQSLIIRTQISKTDLDHQIIEFISSLNKLYKNQISSEDLRRALIQWKAENNAITLHPAKLLHQVVIDRIDLTFVQLVELVTVDEINKAIKAWLNPERIRILLLGANMPKKQDIEKAGLVIWTN